MALSTRSLFYFGYEITASNSAIDFSEGGSELQATLEVGSYTLTDFVTEIERALNDVGALTYTVSVARATRLITISAGSNFELLTSTGTRSGTSAYGLMGFSGSDKTGDDTYTGAAASGSSFTTQYVLQSYVSSEDSRKAASAVVNKSASGRVEIVSFGEERFVEFNNQYITNRTGVSPLITDNATGVENARTWMRFLITKAPFEFMADKDTPGTFEKLILESTPEDQNGLAYKLKEMTGKSLPGFFETGTLKCRVDLS